MFDPCCCSRSRKHGCCRGGLGGPLTTSRLLALAFLYLLALCVLRRRRPVRSERSVSSNEAPPARSVMDLATCICSCIWGTPSHLSIRAPRVVALLPDADASRGLAAASLPSPRRPTLSSLLSSDSRVFIRIRSRLSPGRPSPVTGSTSRGRSWRGLARAADRTFCSHCRVLDIYFQYPSIPPWLAGRLPAASPSRLDDSRLRLPTAWQYVTRIRGAGESEKEGVLRHESAPCRRLAPLPELSSASSGLSEHFAFVPSSHSRGPWLHGRGRGRWRGRALASRR